MKPSTMRTRSARVCAHCNNKSNKASNTITSNHTSRRIACPVVNCASTFGRPSDLVRHQRSIHGPKAKCIYVECGYATGRVDKMKEHVRKMHRPADAGTNILDNNSWASGSPQSEASLDILPGENMVDYNSITIASGGYEASTQVDMIDFGSYDSWSTLWGSADPGVFRELNVFGPFVTEAAISFGIS